MVYVSELGYNNVGKRIYWEISAEGLTKRIDVLANEADRKHKKEKGGKKWAGYLMKVAFGSLMNLLSCISGWKRKLL
jgi:hypothetical protein